MKEIKMNVYADREEKEQGNLFGIFFEDLNHAADGGLYGELVQNRSFEFDRVDAPDYHAMTAWTVVERGESVVRAHVEMTAPLNGINPHYLVVEVITTGEGGVSNEGFAPGIPVVEGKEYRFSCYCRISGQRHVPLEVRLEDKSGTRCYAQGQIFPEGGEWEKYELTLSAQGTDYEGRLVLLAREPVRLELDMVSLFPGDALGVGNGLRADIAKMLMDMTPGFVRFPGGCLTHIGSLDRNDRCGMYRWKNTVGPVEARPARRNTWNYNQTFGLGFYEFFCFCEAAGAEPLPVISAGYDPHSLRSAELNEMQEWIDEALDLIEFANGSSNSGWGGLRAQMGHPESFGMKYLGIGNEEVGDGFFARYEMILDAVKERYPEIQVINSAGPGSGGSEFEKGWAQSRRTKTSYVDEHFYQCPEWFIANADRYRDYQPQPKAFLGEYASQDDAWKNALAEAAFMIGLEKAPGVGLACYAPLLCNENYVNWKPTLLYYDNHQVYGSPCYYVQKLFMNYQGKTLLTADADTAKPSRKALSLHGRIAMGTTRADVEITGFCFKDAETGEEKTVSPFVLSEKHPYQECLCTQSSRYEVAFCFCRHSGSVSESLDGKRSFDLEFAVRDGQNKLKWTIDGWQRLTSLKGVCNGNECDMGLHLFATEQDRVYSARLVVDGCQVRAYIDGKECGSHACRDIEAEELYYSAVRTQDERVVIKAVNVQSEAKKLCIALHGGQQWKKVDILAMEGFRPEDRNSFAEPEKVSPAAGQAAVSENQFCYTLPGQSMAVLCFSK